MILAPAVSLTIDKSDITIKAAVHRWLFLRYTPGFSINKILI